MLDHVFLTVSNIKRSTRFYEAVLAPLGINERFDYPGRNGPPGHPDLNGFGAGGRMYLWLREGAADNRAAHVGFVVTGCRLQGAACRDGDGICARGGDTREPGGSDSWEAGSGVLPVLVNEVDAVAIRV